MSKTACLAPTSASPRTSWLAIPLHLVLDYLKKTLHMSPRIRSVSKVLGLTLLPVNVAHTLPETKTTLAAEAAEQPADEAGQVPPEQDLDHIFVDTAQTS